MSSFIYEITPHELQLTPDLVLRAQGMDPALARQRRPALVRLTEEALEAGLSLLAPKAAYAPYPVESLLHTRLELAGGDRLEGELVASQMAGAETITAAVCTVGEAISNKVSGLFQVNPGLAMALDGMASAAAEVLANHLCQELEAQAAAMGRQTSLPINPGMEGWPVPQGQPQIFALVDAGSIGVSLTQHCLMMPLKSVSFVMGSGTGMQHAVDRCQFCTRQKTCQYRQD